MTCRLRSGPREIHLVRDKDAHRTYRVKYLVECDTTDGPANVLQTPGLPTYGSEYLIDGDLDIWAWCRWEAEVKQVVTREPCTLYEVDVLFSTKPDAAYCKLIQTEDPLLEPQKVSIAFSRYSEEASHDRFGREIKNSAHEPIQGQQVEFDATRFQVTIEQNVADLQLPLICSLRDAVNDAELWGMQKRCVKLTNFSAEKKYYGACQKYYTRRFEFEARYDGFDRDILDQGTKVLNGHWDSTDQGAWVLDNINGSPPDKNNPDHFIRFQDQKGNTARVVLDGNGEPCQKDDDIGTVMIASTAILLDHEFTPAGQPTSDSVIQINVVDNPPSIGTLTMEVYGKRTVAPGLTVDFLETVYIGGGVYEARTKAQFHSVGAIYLRSESTADTIGDTFAVAAVDVKHGPGKIHVEKHNEANLLLLGIPTDLEA